MLKKEIIKAVKINQLFHEISYEYGYDAEQYLDELFNLIENGRRNNTLKFINYAKIAFMVELKVVTQMAKDI